MINSGYFREAIMKKGLFAFIREIVEDYPNYDMYIKQRENEIMYRHQEFQDDNIGGGKAQNVRNESGEYEAITLADDRYLNSLKRNERAIEQALESSGVFTRDIIYELYFRSNQRYTLDGLAEKIHFSRRKVINLRNDFFEDVAKRLGLL